MTDLPKPRGPSIPSAFDPVDQSPIPGLTDETEDQSIPGNRAKVLYDRYPDLTRAELERLSILPPGTELEQGAVYFDLLRPGDGPFKALGGQKVPPDALIIAKRDTDFEIWNRIVEKDRLEETHPAIERPEREDHAVTNQATLND
jgi:hypothetical protein